MLKNIKDSYQQIVMSQIAQETDKLQAGKSSKVIEKLKKSYSKSSGIKFGWYQMNPDNRIKPLLNVVSRSKWEKKGFHEENMI